MVRQFRGGNRQNQPQTDIIHNRRNDGIYKQDRGNNNNYGRQGGRRDDNNNSKRTRGFRRFNNNNGRRRNNNNNDDNLQREDKLDSQLDSYWTKHGKPNKIDKNATLDKQLDNYWKNKGNSTKEKDSNAPETTEAVTGDNEIANKISNITKEPDSTTIQLESTPQHAVSTNVPL